jgi:hypothetical protein
MYGTILGGIFWLEREVSGTEVFGDRGAVISLDLGG